MPHRPLVLALVLSTATFVLAGQTAPTPRLIFGIVTDVHSADVATNGARTYRASAAKLAACIDVMNARRVAFVAELGDFKDQDQAPIEANTLRYLADIERVFASFNGPRYHVLGNHDTDSLSKAQFLAATVNTGVPAGDAHYSFVAGGVRFVVLDANHNADGTPYDHGNFTWEQSYIDIPQLAWLDRTLHASAEPAIVLVHQRLDTEDDYAVKNAEVVRAVIERSGKVLAVLQGHHHEGGFSQINGVPYYTLAGLVQGPPLPDNAFATVEVRADWSLAITGYGRAASREFSSEAVRRMVTRRPD
jgi:alkaline phosphatase